jgi:hypothetical protein
MDKMLIKSMQTTNMLVVKNSQKRNNIFFVSKKLKVLITFLLVLSSSVSAREINVKTVAFHIDSTFTVVESKVFPFQAANQSAVIALASPDWKDFSIEKIFASMDTLCFNLAGAKLLKDKSEPFFKWSKDCFTKYYELPNGIKVITHTFYTYGVAYCLYAGYTSVEDEKLIKETINSIWFNSQQHILNKLLSVFNYASLFWIIFAIITSILGIILKESKTSIFSSVIGFSLIAGLLLWGVTGTHWEIIGCALLVYNLILILAYYLGIHIKFDVD